jgi:hypothetical protein
VSGPFPEDSAERKMYPVFSGVLQYFPAAIAALANHSYLGNEKHNPGQPLHWARGKSDDHLDAAGRHLTERDLRGLAWRALAALQLEEEAKGAPIAPGARIPPRAVEVSPIIPHRLAAEMLRDGVVPADDDEGEAVSPGGTI